MWSILENPKTVRVTKSLAKEFADMEPAPRDRDLSERRLNVYRQMLKNGEFRPVAWAKCFCEETGQTYRVNGKHTSTLLSSLPVMPEFFVTIESYSTPTLEDVSKLYGSFDSRIQSRTSADINRSFAATNPDLAEMQGRVVNVVVTGLAFHKWLERYSAQQAADRAELILDNVDFAVWANSILLNGTGKSQHPHMFRGPVVAAMFATYTRSQRGADEFWREVRDESNPMPKSPSRTLAKFLVMNSVSTGQGGNAPASRKASPREFYVKCVYAWNSWRKGKDSQDHLKFYPKGDIPVVA